METITATRARSNLFKILESVSRTRQQKRITSKSGPVVLISEDDYEELLETLEILSAPNALKKFEEAERDIEAGRLYSMEEAFGEEI